MNTQRARTFPQPIKSIIFCFFFTTSVIGINTLSAQTLEKTNELNHPTNRNSSELFNLSQLSLQGKNWHLSASQLVLNDQESGFYVVSPTFIPCNQVNNFFRITAEKASFQKAQLSLEKPQFIVGDWKIPLPNLSLDPQEPSLGTLRLQTSSKFTRFELGPSFSYSSIQYTPTLIYSENSVGFGVKLKDHTQELKQETFWSSGGTLPSLIRIESQGGQSIYTLKGGGLFHLNRSVLLESRLNRSLLVSQPLSLPKHVLLRVNFFADQQSVHSLIFSMKSSTHQDLYVNEQLISNRAETDLAQLRFKSIWQTDRNIFDDQTRVKFTLLNNIYTTLGTTINTRNDLFLDHSFVSLSPYVHTKLGESYLVITSEQLVSQLGIQQQSTLGLEHELQLHKFVQLSSDPQHWLSHVIRLNPQFLFHLPIYTTGQQTIPPNRTGTHPHVKFSEIGMNVSQDVSWKNIHFSYQFWTGYQTNSHQLGEILTDDQDMHRLSIEQMNYAHRSRLSTPNFFIDVEYSSHRDTSVWFSLRKMPINHQSLGWSMNVLHQQYDLFTSVFSSKSKPILSNNTDYFLNAVFFTPLHMRLFNVQAMSSIVEPTYDYMMVHSKDVLAIEQVYLNLQFASFIFHHSLWGSLTRDNDMRGLDRDLDQTQQGQSEESNRVIRSSPQFELLGSKHSVMWTSPCTCWHMGLELNIRRFDDGDHTLSRNQSIDQTELLFGFKIGLGKARLDNRFMPTFN